MKRNRLWAEVDLDALKHNFAQIKKLLSPGTKIMAVVKANAYGHGAVPVAKALVGYGVDMLGVGDSSEALELRRADITAPILVLGALIEDEVPRVVHEGITPCIHSRDIARLLQDEAARQNVMLDVHVNVDTGMGRLGTSPRNAVEMLKEIAGMPNLKMRGLMTHFSSAGAVSRNTINQQLVGLSPGTGRGAALRDTFRHPAHRQQHRGTANEHDAPEHGAGGHRALWHRPQRIL